METHIPKNSINVSEQISELTKLKNENTRLRENNVDLKLRLLESTEKLNRINKIIQKTRIHGITV
jgi:predicted  nucleic acid-binding Zn-ribbon protein